MSAARRPDAMRTVTPQDVAGALVAMASLPKRVELDAAVERAAYAVAVGGVRASALATAVRSILQGALGHGFFPSPPELRIECDKADADRRAAALREAQRERARREAAATPPIEHDEASKARVREIYERFKRQSAAAKLETMAQEGFRSGLPGGDAGTEAGGHGS